MTNALLENGANVNADDKDGWTPLNFAAMARALRQECGVKSV